MATATRKETAKRAPAKKLATKTPTAPAAAMPADKPRKVLASRGPTDATESLKTAASDVGAKSKKVRGTFSMPKADHARIAVLKDVAKKTGINVKKNELLRLGLQHLQGHSASELHDMILALRRPERKPAKRSRE